MKGIITKDLPANTTGNYTDTHLKVGDVVYSASDPYGCVDKEVGPIVLLSGGLDSTTLLYWVRKNVAEPQSISFHYGQRHLKELYKSREITRLGGFSPNVIVDLAEARIDENADTNLHMSSVADLIRKGSQTDFGTEVPEGHYAAESMKQTVVPNRNMIMLSIAVGWAVTTGTHSVYYAAHQGDHTVYPDCRPEFFQALNQAVELGNAWDGVSLVAPFMHIDKAEIVKLGAELGVPFELTYSCYKGGSKACGKCGTCTERLEAFQQNGLKDPLEYE